MARRIFWRDSASRVDDPSGTPIAGASVTAWTRRTGGAQITDLRTVDDDGVVGAAIAGGVLVTDGNGYLPSFAGPANGTFQLWVDAGGATGRVMVSAEASVNSDPGGSGLFAGDGTFTAIPRPVRYLISNRSTDRPDFLVDATTGAATRTSDGSSLGTGADKAWQAALDGCGAYQARKGLIMWADGTYHLKGPLRMDTGIRMAGAGADVTNLVVDADFSVGSVTGFLDAANAVPRAGVIMPDWQGAGFSYVGGRWEIDRLRILMGAYDGTDAAGIVYTVDAQPPAAVVPGTRGVDPGHRIEHIVIDQSATHGIAFVVRDSFTVTNKALAANVATLTIGTHPFVASSVVSVSGVDATFNGTQTLTAVTATTISYAKTAANVASTASGGTVGGYSGSARESRIANCEVARSGRITTGWDFWLDASDLYLYGCTGNGARSGGFRAAGGNHRYTNCKAYFTGNIAGGQATPGFDFASSRGIAIGCESQDNGGEGFVFRTANWIGEGLLSDSNGAYAASRTIQGSANIAVLANSVHVSATSFQRSGGNGDPGYPIWFTSGRSFISGDVNQSRGSGTWTTSPTANTPNNALTSSNFTITGSAT